LKTIVKGGKMKKKKECPSWVMKTVMSLLFLLFCFAEQSSFGVRLKYRLRLKYGQIIKIKNTGTGDYLAGSFGVNYGGDYVNPYMSPEGGVESLWIIKGKHNGGRWDCDFGSEVKNDSSLRLESVLTGGNIQVWTHHRTIGGNAYPLYFWGMSTGKTTRDRGILDYGDNLIVRYDENGLFRLMSDSSHSCGNRYFYATKASVQGHPDKKEVAATTGNPADRYWKAEFVEQADNGVHAEILVNNLARTYSLEYIANLIIQTESLTKINESFAKELADIEDYPAGFFRKPGTGLKDISVGKDVIVGEGKEARKILQAWAIGEDNKLLKWVGGSNPWESHIAQSGIGEEIPGFKSISIGFNNDTYAVGIDGKIYHYNPTGEPSPKITKLDEDVVLTESVVKEGVKSESVEEAVKAKEKQKVKLKKDKKKKGKKRARKKKKKKKSKARKKKKSKNKLKKDKKKKGKKRVKKKKKKDKKVKKKKRKKKGRRKKDGNKGAKEVEI